MIEETNQTVETENEEVASPDSQKETISEAPSELDRAKMEIESLKDSWQRERAEFQNYKRRTAQELLNARKESVKRLAEGLLIPLDNMDRVTSIQNPSDEVRAFLDGVRMIQKEFFSVLEKEQIHRLDPKGQSFDPMFMEAIASEESEEVTEEIVSETYQFGFYHQDGENKQSIRPARVKIAKPKSN